MVFIRKLCSWKTSFCCWNLLKLEQDKMQKWKRQASNSLFNEKLNFRFAEHDFFLLIFLILSQAKLIFKSETCERVETLRRVALTGWFLIRFFTRVDTALSNFPIVSSPSQRVFVKSIKDISNQKRHIGKKWCFLLFCGVNSDDSFFCVHWKSLLVFAPTIYWLSFADYLARFTKIAFAYWLCWTSES